MTNWVVESWRFPYLPIELTAAGRTAHIEAFIDTGFDGDVVAPGTFFTGSSAPSDSLRWRLADGSQIVAPAYRGELRIGSVVVAPVVVTALGDEPIVGRGVIDRFGLILDHGRRVVVEP